jgi:alpha-glucan,water dikinase
VQDWYHVIDIIQNKSQNWALRTKAVLDRTRLALQDKAEYYQKILQPTAEYLGSLLGVEEWAVSIPTYRYEFNRSLCRIQDNS